MSEPTNEPVILTGYKLIELIRPVILAHTKHEGYTDQIIEVIDTGAQMRIGFDSLSPAAMLTYTAIGLLDPVDPIIIEVFTGILLDKLRITEPPADLPLRDAWLHARDEVMRKQAEAVALGAMADVEVHSLNSSDLEVDWSQLNDLDVTKGETNG